MNPQIPPLIDDLNTNGLKAVKVQEILRLMLVEITQLESKHDALDYCVSGVSDRVDKLETK